MSLILICKECGEHYATHRFGGENNMQFIERHKTLHGLVEPDYPSMVDDTERLKAMQDFFDAHFERMWTAKVSA